MKIFVTALTALSLWGLLSIQSVAAPLKVVIFELPPLEYEEQGAFKGAAVDIVSEVFSRMKQPITLELYPFARALKMMKEGSADAIFAIVKKPERELFLDFPSEALIEQTASMFVKMNAPIQFDGALDKLSAYRFGILIGATYGPQWDEAIKSGIINKIEAVPDYRQNVLKLVNNRVDIMIGPRLPILYTIEKLEQQGAVRELSPSIEIVPTYLAFSKSRVSSEIKAQFERALKSLKEDGSYDKIIHSYTH